MSKSWAPLLALAVLAVVALLAWQLLRERSFVDDGTLTNPTITRLERQVDSLRLVIGRRDSAILAYQGRLADLDSSLTRISQRNTVLLTDLNRRKEVIDYAIPNDSLARDLNRILRASRLAGAGAAAAGSPR